MMMREAIWWWPEQMRCVWLYSMYLYYVVYCRVFTEKNRCFWWWCVHIGLRWSVLSSLHPLLLLAFNILLYNPSIIYSIHWAIYAKGGEWILLHTHTYTNTLYNTKGNSKVWCGPTFCVGFGTHHSWWCDSHSIQKDPPLSGGSLHTYVLGVACFGA